MWAVRIRGRHFNSRQPSGLNNLNLDCGMSLNFLLGGLMRGIEIPLQDFALKMQGGLMREGGGDTTVNEAANLVMKLELNSWQHLSSCDFVNCLSS